MTYSTLERQLDRLELEMVGRTSRNAAPLMPPDRDFRTADEINRRQHRISGRLTLAVERLVDGTDDPTKIKALADTLEKSVEMERVSAGLPTTPHRIEVMEGPDRLEDRVMQVIETLRQRAMAAKERTVEALPPRK